MDGDCPLHLNTRDAHDMDCVYLTLDTVYRTYRTNSNTTSTDESETFVSPTTRVSVKTELDPR